MYELYDPCTVMFFYRSVHDFRIQPRIHLGVVCRNKHIMIDLGTGNNNKMSVSVTLPYECNSHPYSVSNWAMDNKQEVGHIRL